MSKMFNNIPVVFKIGILSSMLLTFMLGLGGVAIYFTQQIGAEIESIAEGDLPMISILTEIEVNQLEQAILFERAIRQGEKEFGQVQVAANNNSAPLSHGVTPVEEHAPVSANEHGAAENSVHSAPAGDTHEEVGDTHEAPSTSGHGDVLVGDAQETPTISHGLESDFSHLSAEFIHLGEKIVEEYGQAELIITSAITHAPSAETVANYETFRAKLLEYEHLHEAYEAHVEAIFHLIAQGDVDEALAQYPELEVQQHQVDAQIENLVLHVEHQTERSAHVAEEHEKTMLSAIYWSLGLAIIFGSAIALLMGSIISKSLKTIAATMKELTEGNLDIEIPYASRADEIGQMAKSVEIFKENAQKVAQMSDDEKAAIEKRNADRAAMMAQLGEAFGTVVNAAASGDFSKRCEAKFADEELNKMGVQVNELVNNVERGLKETGAVLGALAKTDLTQRVKGEYQGSFLELKKDTNAVADRLSEIVGQLRETSGELKSATGEILAGANDLSERTTKQAANVEETSATMEQLSSTVVESAQQADGASERSAQLAKTAEETGTVVEQATEAMERITSSSAKISNVIGMIDDIAFQTNLLALNASVEAARAGEAGKGFAVVAVEVRRLAQSAAEASTEVKQLIEQSAVEVTKGTGFVSSAAERLQSMIEGIQKNSTLMAGLAETSRDQASSIEEINAAVRQMDEMTQHNAALVEETNAAIEQTDSQVNALDQIIEVFKLAGSGNIPSASGVTAPSSTQTSPDANIPVVKQMQEKAASAAKSYLSEGSAAVDSDWGEF